MGGVAGTESSITDRPIRPKHNLHGVTAGLHHRRRRVATVTPDYWRITQYAIVYLQSFNVISWLWKETPQPYYHCMMNKLTRKEYLLYLYRVTISTIMNIDVYFIICKFINIIIFVIIFTRYSRKKKHYNTILYMNWIYRHFYTIII